MIPLLDNQSKAVEKLQKFKVGALFMKPGTGKTRTALELARSVNEIDFVLWLTPCRTKDNLKAEIELHGSMVSILIYGIESLSSSNKLYLTLYSLVEKHNVFLIVDESLKIKNWEAKRTKRIIEISKHCEYKLILNGTPVTKNLLDIWAQMDCLSPKILNMGLPQFKNTFCEYTTIKKRVGAKSFSKEFITAYHNIDYLYSLIGHYIYECDLNLLIQTHHKEIKYKVDRHLKDEYNFLKEKYLDNENLKYMNNNIFLQMTQKMQHTYCLTSEKFVILCNILNNVDRDKVLIYCKYKKSANAVMLAYPDLTVLTYGKHSLGLNLQSKNTIIYFDKTFDYSQMQQSSYRIYRTGQIDDCFYYHLTGDVGLESIIKKNIDKKISLSEYFKSKGIQNIIKEL